jgi:hypothetical protein
VASRVYTLLTGVYQQDSSNAIYPTKSVACMSTSWLLGNVYLAKSCKDKKRAPDALKLGLVSYGRQP